MPPFCNTIGTVTAVFSITLVFPDIDDPDFPMALELARQTPGFRQTGGGATTRYRARFLAGDAARLREVYDVVGPSNHTGILVNDQFSLFINP